MKWQQAEKASKWKEGSVVVINRLDRPQDEYKAYELTQWFRPDYVENENGYGKGKHIFFLKLSGPK